MRSGGRNRGQETLRAQVVLAAADPKRGYHAKIKKASSQEKIPGSAVLRQ
jgi:hypothetical protein